ncbi:ribosomal protein S6 kinase alpha-5 isoform X2 [Tribolium castaneum]|uniref:ribosomal protein S6 kinase alpha-5 isoform X2 n=1 Tax=Tribolium castaneum TaxID=7070 RepID=UPI00046C1EA7|nr:PREDICTED: ribosomal protein S6 kinase alpha-5 isoform X2 [Tribolium castaneum]|eukprot:XP_008199672.1 PREDICTED: ribosomal protein S6 kinase alpha-5 isoform X2 [Tribolium castaneum]
MAMESSVQKQDNATFSKTPKPLSRSPGTSPSIRNMTQTVIVSLAETVTHDITYVNLSGVDRVNMSHFDLLKVLGTGAYGKVFLVRKRGGADNNRLYAMKVLKKATIVQKKKTTEHTKTERQVLEAVRDNPFLVTLHYAFQTDAKLHLILDYVAGGELFTHLYQREHFTEDEVRIYIGEIILALERLHSLGIIYRDIKLENILVDESGHIVLTDFGLSKELPREGDNDQRAYSFCGTIEYMAPEVVKGGTQGHDIAVDWWSVGVLTYELLTGASPFTVEGEKNTQQEISRRILKTTPPIPDSLGKDVADFISKLLVKDPRKRLGGGEGDAKELKKHSFFKSLDWEKLARKEIPAPFKPVIRSELDVSNFSEEFTQMPPTDSPAVVPPNYDKIFKGYSYVAPSVLFTKNAISDEILKPAKQHDSTKLISCKINNSQFFQTYDIDLNEPILGDGTFSVCRKCVNLQTGKEYAVKIVSRKKDCSQEINLLRACQGHPNIVTLHDVIQDEAHTYLVLEYLKGGELFERIRKKSKFTESEASGILRKLVSAVSFMHSCGVVHRDLKPENLVFTDDDDSAEIKVIDFGFARLKQEKESLHTPCFTLHYAAPEVLKGDPEGYDENCDLWSLGVILYTMLCGKAPFHARSRDENVSSIMERIKEGDFNFNSSAWTGVSNEAKSVVRGLLTVNPGQRLRMSHLETNPWVQGSQHFVSTPLMTPDVLLETAPEKSLQTTFNAFHKAQREGFRLQDVFSAKLAQRRRMKKSSSGDNSTSSSSFTSEGSLKSGPKLSVDVKKTDKVALGGNVFNFGENRVTEFLETMSSNPLDPETVSPCRESTSSSGIVMSDKNSVDTKVVGRKRQKKVYVQTRWSERIRRRQRQEIDLDPVPVKHNRKRKVDERESIESTSSSSKRKKTMAPLRKSKKSKIGR